MHSEATKVIALDVIELLGLSAGRYELVEELLLRIGEESAPLGEGVEVRDALLDVEGTSVDRDVAKMRQLEEGEGKLEHGLHLVLGVIWGLNERRVHQ